MIVIKFELWPGGNELRARELGRTYVWNEGEATTKNTRYGDYHVAVARRGDTRGRPSSLSFAPTRRGYVTGYPRASYNMWRLVIRALLACFPEEKAK